MRTLADPTSGGDGDGGGSASVGDDEDLDVGSGSRDDYDDYEDYDLDEDFYDYGDDTLRRRRQHRGPTAPTGGGARPGGASRRAKNTARSCFNPTRPEGIFLFRPLLTRNNKFPDAGEPIAASMRLPSIKRNSQPRRYAGRTRSRRRSPLARR